MIRVKPGVSFAILRREIWSIFDVIEVVYEKRSLTAMITCGTDSHGPNDPHSHAYAVDIGTHEVPQAELKPMHQELADRLGPDYTVLYDDKNIHQAEYIDTPNSHFHIQVRKDIWHARAGIPE